MSSRRRLLVDLAGTSRLWSLPESGRERLLAETPPDWETVVVRDGTPAAQETGSASTSEAIALAAEAEAYFSFGVTRELFLAAPRLRWIHSAAAGVGKSISPELRASDVAFTNSSGTMADAIAEYVLGGALHFLRGFDLALGLQGEREWDKGTFQAEESAIRELCECRVVMVGTGALGQAIARRLSALGATCVGVRRHPEQGAPPGFARVVAAGALDEELREADVVVLAAPLTPHTKGLLSASRMDCLPPRAIVVNVGRGALLDEGALAQRVRGGQIRGAVLDVFQREPLPPDSPLWGVPGVVVTPHVAAVSPRLFWRRTLDLFLDNWQRYRTGAPLRNVVNKEAGY